jgi:hypothetical protein
MLDLLVVLVMQAAAGDPATAQPAPTQTTAEAPGTQEPQTVSAGTTVVLVPETEAFEGVRCERASPTGSRVRRREVVCTTEQSRRETRDTASAMANSGGRGPYRQGD